MKNLKLSNRYAKALFDFAQEKGCVEEVHRDLVLIKQSLRESHELHTILNSPVVAPLKKHAIFASVFQSNTHEVTFGFLDVLIKKKREPMLDGICEEFVGYYNELHRIKVATLTTAQELSPALVEKIREILAEKTQYTIEIRQIVKPDIIGGILIKMDDFYFDASIISKINKLKQEFTHNIYQVNF